MSSETVLPELDVFQLPVFADADIWPMWPAGKLAELADDIKENGFDHRYPITVAEIDGQWMLLDGRNRREAARIAGINPPVIVTDIDPKLAVHRSNNQNRDATPGQKAMATAMAWPDTTDKGGRGKKGKTVDPINGFDKAYLSRARFVLRNNPPAPKSRFPQYALDVMDGRMTLTEAYDATLKDECGVAEKHFRRLAKAYWADTVKKDREDAEAQLDLFEQAKGFDAPTALNGLIEGGLVSATYTRGEALQ